ADFIALVQKHGIPFHQKHKGQLFADRSAEDIIQMLLAECEAGQVTRWQPCSINNIAFLASSAPESSAGSYLIDTSQGPVHPR
ncbi:NAD(P)/FAD-dependent oxidoreductase, partial [Acinetobacter baumannii]